jgi:non-canonical poly(A) RNA polymerase PAPD5/7
VRTEKEIQASIPAEALDFISCGSDSDGGDEDVQSSINKAKNLDAPRSVLHKRETSSLAALKDKDAIASEVINQAPVVVGLAGDCPPSTSKPRRITRQTSLHPPHLAPMKATAGEELTSSALGSRKRTHDDQIILPAHSKLKRVSKMPVGGALTWDWQIAEGEDPCPWNTVDHSASPNMGVW